MEITGFVVMCTVVFAAPGLGLLLWGISARRRDVRSAPAPTAPRLPTAKIEDGRSLPSSTGPDLPLARAGAVRIALGILLAIVGGVFGCFAGIFAEGMSGMFRFGRPLRVQGRPRRGRRARGTGWHDEASPRVERMGAWKRAWLGERWLAAARAEHASVPAFRRLGRQLVAVGAPAALVDRCEAAAGDEIRHARRCFALARVYSGVDWTAGTLSDADDAADAPIDLSSLAVESLLDGCLGEAIAADLAREGARRAADPVIGASLEMIANDEAVHAELAWAVVGFCIERGRPEVSRALAGAARTARAGASRGPTDLARSECRRIADARLSSVRQRLAALMAGAVRTDPRA